MALYDPPAIDTVPNWIPLVVPLTPIPPPTVSLICKILCTVAVPIPIRLFEVMRSFSAGALSVECLILI